ncbi:MAG: phage tail protein [Bradymonadales bacterium]|jgi:phage tail-like protein
MAVGNSFKGIEKGAARRVGDPVANFMFTASIDGLGDVHCNGVDGLSYEVDMIEYRSSDKPMVPRFRQGLNKLGRVTLKRGYLNQADGRKLLAWLQEVESKTMQRRNINISLSDQQVNDNERMSWTLVDCMPTKWNISSLDGKGNEIVVESIEFVCETMLKDK